MVIFRRLVKRIIFLCIILIKLQLESCNVFLKKTIF